MPSSSSGNDDKPLKVMCFLDFWNYELTMKSSVMEPKFLTDWYKLPKVLVTQAGNLLGRPALYERLFVAGSYDAGSIGDAKLFTWANNVLGRIPGVVVSFTQRQRRTTGPHCIGPKHCEVTTCPHCGASMLGTQEKGVDTRIVTEMLDTALTGQCDVLVLVSADKDFIPAIEKLGDKNIKCIHAFFPHNGYELGKACWASFDLFSIRDQFRR
jgi:uncharacterized LabA/DUF88 family protein